MASAWIFQESAESPPESTIATAAGWPFFPARESLSSDGPGGGGWGEEVARRRKR